MIKDRNDCKKAVKSCGHDAGTYVSSEYILQIKINAFIKIITKFKI